MSNTILSVTVLIAGVLIALWTGWRRGKAAGGAAGREEAAPRLQKYATDMALLEQSLTHERDMGAQRALEAAAQRDDLHRQAQEHKDAASALNAELTAAKARMAELEAISAKDAEILAAERGRIEGLHRQDQELRAQADTLNAELTTLKTRMAELEAVSAKDKEILAAERAQLEGLRVRLTQEFENLANKIFDSKQTSFEARSREGLGTLLGPFREQLESFRKRVDQVHTESVQGQATLKGELGRLQELNRRITQEASDLTRALKGDKKLQGNWGEHKLELLLEQAGLRKGIEYEREKNFKDDAGANFRPDFTVMLPDGKNILIDSKVSLVAYSDYVAEEDPEARRRHLAAHVAALRDHIKRLGAKSYPSLVGVDSPDFTFMFIAVEPAYIAAAEHTPSLFLEAFHERVALITASALLPTLRVVANLWTLQRRNESSEKLAREAGRIYDKFCVFLSKMERLGVHLNSAQDSFRESMVTLKDGRGSLVGAALRMRSFGAKTTKPMPQSVGGFPLGELGYSGQGGPDAVGVSDESVDWDVLDDGGEGNGE